MIEFFAIFVLLIVAGAFLGGGQKMKRNVKRNACPRCRGFRCECYDSEEAQG